MTPHLHCGGRIIQQNDHFLRGASAGVYPIGGPMGRGSPIMERIIITSQYDIESRKKLVKYLRGNKD